MDDSPRDRRRHHHRPTPGHSEPLPPRSPRSRRRPKRSTFALSTAGLAALAGVPLAVVALNGAPPRPADIAAAPGETPVLAAADTYVIREDPAARNGGAAKLTAANRPDWRTDTYLSFTVPSEAGADGIRAARVELTFNKLVHQAPVAELRSVPGTGWSEGDTAWRNRPAAGPVVATARITPGATRQVSFDVGAVVRGPGAYAFAITDPVASSSLSFHSRESGPLGPKLLVNRGPAGQAAAPPTGSGDATPPPIVEPAPTRRIPSPAIPPHRGHTLCGASFTPEPGETFLDALRRKDREYGGLDMVRVFHGGLPAMFTRRTAPGPGAALPGRLGDVDRTIVVSFKLNPRDVLAGKHDAYLSRWFATAPRDQEIHWVYYHEPEDNIAKGEFNAADYRAAWRRLRALADRADNPKLRATLVLMGWSLDPRSRRDWRNYYPGRDVVQALGWDVYNDDKIYRAGAYQPPAQMFARVIGVSRAERLPFGIAETGSFLVPGDRGDRRAAWLRGMVDHLERARALWVAYFDLNWPTGDYRLQDKAGKTAWRNFCYPDALRDQAMIP